MFTKKKKRYSIFKKAKYYNQVQEYLQDHSFEIVQKIYNGSLNSEKLTEENVAQVMTGSYPVAPWADETNIVEQFVAMLEEVGYRFARNKQGQYSFKDEELYGAIVKTHLIFSGSHVLDALSECCAQNNGRITYFQAQNILGLRYPKAPYVNKADIRACTILFLKETGIPFAFDNTYLYFP